MKNAKLHGTLAERKAIGKRFKDFRARQSLSQRELASLLDLGDRATVSDIENAKHLPHHSTLRRFVEFENKSDKEIRNESNFGQDGS